MTTSRYGFEALRAEEKKVRQTPQGNRNNALFKAAGQVGSLVAGGHIDETQAREALTDAALIAGLGEIETRNTINSGFAYGRADPRQAEPRITDRESALAELDRIEAIVCAQPWPGSHGRVLYATLRGVIALARSQGGPGDIPIGDRRLSLEMRTGQTEAGKGLKLARKKGWLKIVLDHTTTRATKYRLRVPPTLAPEVCDLVPGGPCGIVAEAGAGHDAFYRGGLGTTGMMILDHLSRHPEWHERPTLAEILGIVPSTVDNYLAEGGKLTRTGLVETRDGQVRARPDLNVNHLNRAARTLGTRGRADHKRQQLAAAYQTDGRLTDTYQWVNADGEITGSATWLIPEEVDDAE